MFLDALVSLRAKGFPGEEVDDPRRYEITTDVHLRSPQCRTAQSASDNEVCCRREICHVIRPTKEELRYVAMEYVQIDKTSMRSTRIPRLTQNPLVPPQRYHAEPRVIPPANQSTSRTETCEQSNELHQR